MSVSATTNAGGFIGYSAANVNIPRARNGNSSTTAKVYTIGSSTDASAGGFIGYSDNSVSIGIADGDWEYLSSDEWNYYGDPYSWNYSAINYMDVIGYECGGFIGTNNGAFNSWVIKNEGNIGTPELDYTSYLTISLRVASVTDTSTAQQKEFMVSGTGSWKRLTFSNGQWSVATPNIQLPVSNAPTTYAFKVKGTTNTYFFKYGFINYNATTNTTSACNDYGYGFVHSAGGFVGYSLNSVSIKGFSFDEYSGVTYPEDCYYYSDATCSNTGYIGALNYNFGESYAAGYIGYTVSTSTIRFASNSGSIGLTGTKASQSIEYWDLMYYCVSTIGAENPGYVSAYLVKYSSAEYAFYIKNGTSFVTLYDTINGVNTTTVSNYLYVGRSGVEGVAYELEYLLPEVANGTPEYYWPEYSYGDYYYTQTKKATYYLYSFPDLKANSSDNIYSSYFTYWANQSKWLRVGTNYINISDYPSNPGFDISSWTPTKASPFVGHSTVTPTLFCTYNGKGVLGRSVTNEGGTSTSYYDYLYEMYYYYYY